MLVREEEPPNEEEKIRMKGGKHPKRKEKRKREEKQKRKEKRKREEKESVQRKQPDVFLIDCFVNPIGPPTKHK